MIERVEEIVARYSEKPGAAIMVLQGIQNEFGYVPKEVLPKVSELIGVPASDLYGIITFYAQFRLEPIGDNLVQICNGTACHLAGSEEIADSLMRAVGITEGNTSPDGKFTVEKVACLGCCSLAPVMTINGEVFGRLTPDKAVRLIQDGKFAVKEKATQPKVEPGNCKCKSGCGGE